jgi:O-acetyl-ADP-ribose deacetylase (regulator of RNase III)
VPPQVSVVEGDLFAQDVEAIVNPWNRNLIPWWLLLPHGVSGALKRLAGARPFRELARAGVMAPGAAVLTSAGRLSYAAVIHVAGLNLRWRSSEQIVRSCVRNALDVAGASGITSIAFPLIGAGVGGLTPDGVLDAIRDEALRSSFPGRVVIVRWRPT